MNTKLQILSILSRLKGMHVTNQDILSKLVQLPEMRSVIIERRKHHPKKTEEQIKKEIENEYRYAASTALCNLQIEGCIEIDRMKKNPEYTITEKGRKQLEINS